MRLSSAARVVVYLHHRRAEIRRSLQFQTHAHARARARVHCARALGRLVGMVAERKLPKRVLQVFDGCRRWRAHELVPAAAVYLMHKNSIDVRGVDVDVRGGGVQVCVCVCVCMCVRVCYMEQRCT